MGGNFINGASGLLEASNGGSLVLSGASGGTFTNNGNISALTGSQVQLTSSVSITGGTFNSAGTGSVVNTGTATLTNVINAGTFTTNNGTTTTLGGTFSNTGTFTQSSTLNGTGDFTNSGTATISGTQNWTAGKTVTNTAGSTTFQSDPGSASTAPLNVAISGGAVNFAVAVAHIASLNVTGSGQAVVSQVANPLTPDVLVSGAISFTGLSAKLDLTNNEALLTAPAPTVRGEIISGNIFSSLSIANKTVGYLDNGGGVTEVRFTLKGDTNLNGSVDVGDLGALSTAYGATAGAVWAQGDFNYDGKVDVGDLGSLATNYGLNIATGSETGDGDAAVAAPQAATALSATAAAVPEPGTLISLTSLLVLTSRRGRRRR